MDDRGHGLRVSWHPRREIMVLSLWRDDVCVGTFRLRPDDMRRLVTSLEGHLEQEQRLPGMNDSMAAG